VEETGSRKAVFSKDISGIHVAQLICTHLLSVVWCACREREIKRKRGGVHYKLSNFDRHAARYMKQGNTAPRKCPTSSPPLLFLLHVLLLPLFFFFVLFPLSLPSSYSAANATTT